MKKYLITLVLLFAMSAYSYGGNNIERVVESLSAAIENADVTLIENDLSERFSISTASLPRAKTYYLKYILDNRDIQSVAIDHVISEGDTTLVSLTVKRKESQTNSVAAFDSEGKLLFFDYFDKLFGSSRYNKSEFVASIPFTVENNFIFVDVKVNGREKPLKLMFDTGSDGIALNPALKEEMDLTIKRVNNASGTGGSVQVGIVELETVEFDGGLKFEKRNAALFPSWGSSYDGLLGINIFQSHIIYINYQDKKIDLYTHGDYVFSDKGEVIDIIVSDGVVEVEGRVNLIGNSIVSGHFVIDSGAMSFLLCYQNFVRKHKLLLSGFKSESTTPMSGLGGTTVGYNGKAHRFSLGNNIVLENMPVILQASSGATDPRLVDGSIGVGFLSNYNFVIDMLRKKMQFIPLTVK